MPLDHALLIRAAARQGGELGTDDARALFAAMLAGEVAPHEFAPVLAAWRYRCGSLAEITGLMRALDAHAAALECPLEGPRPVVLAAYRGTSHQANLTALVALLLQRYEVPVLVHGPGSQWSADAAPQSRAGMAVADPVVAAAEDRSGRAVMTADVLQELGIGPAASLADAQERLRRDKFAYLPATLIAPGLAQLLGPPTRDTLPAIVHSLALLIDPFRGGGYRVIGAASAEGLATLREFLLAARSDALLFPGTEGEPFADPRRQARLEHIAGGAATLCADVEADGVTRECSLPAAPDAATTAAWIAKVVAGTEPIPAPIIMQLGCCLAGARRQGATT